jgi:hypothetical protein
MNAQKQGLFEAWRFATFPQMIFFLNNTICTTIGNVLDSNDAHFFLKKDF